MAPATSLLSLRPPCAVPHAGSPRTKPVFGPGSRPKVSPWGVRDLFPLGNGARAVRCGWEYRRGHFSFRFQPAWRKEKTSCWLFTVPPRTPGNRHEREARKWKVRTRKCVQSHGRTIVRGAPGPASEPPFFGDRMVRGRDRRWRRLVGGDGRSPHLPGSRGGTRCLGHRHTAPCFRSALGSY